MKRTVSDIIDQKIDFIPYLLVIAIFDRLRQCSGRVQTVSEDCRNDVRFSQSGIVKKRMGAEAPDRWVCVHFLLELVYLIFSVLGAAFSFSGAAAAAFFSSSSWVKVVVGLLLGFARM